MAASTTSETWDALWTLTARAKRKRLTDNISDAYPTIDAFRRSGVMETENGGKQIQEDLMYALQDPEWFDMYDVLSTDRLDGITAAFYDWAYLASNVSIAMTEEKENRASDKAIKLLEAKTRQAMQGAMDTANAAILGAQSGKACLGLQDIVPEAGTGTVGGINSATETWWQSQSYDYNNVHASDGFLNQNNSGAGDFYNGITAMKELYNLVFEGNDTPNMIITTKATKQDYETIFEGTGHLRTTIDGSKSIDGRGAAWRGMSFIGDADCTTDHLYMLNTKYLKFKVQAGMNFSKTPFKENANQLARTCYIVLGCQLTCNHRQRQGVLYDIINGVVS